MPRYNGPKVRGNLFNIATIDPKRGQMSATYAAKYDANGFKNGAKNGANGANNLENEPFIESNIRPITSNNVTRRKQLKQRIGNAINKGNDSFLNNIQHFIESYYHKQINPRGIRSNHPHSLQSRKLAQLKNSEFKSPPIYTIDNSNISDYQLKKKFKKSKPGQVTFKGNVGYNNVGYNNDGTIIRPNYRSSNNKFQPYRKNLDYMLPPPKPPRPIPPHPILPDPNIV